MNLSKTKPTHKLSTRTEPMEFGKVRILKQTHTHTVGSKHLEQSESKWLRKKLKTLGSNEFQAIE